MLRNVAFLLSIGLAVVAPLGCSEATSQDDTQDELAAAGEGEPQHDVLQVLTQESPSQGPSFNFCPTPPADAPLQLVNAAWLALASANEYAHLGYFAPQLLDLGFGSPADSLWAQCGRDLGRTRDFEHKHLGELEAKKKEGPEALVRFMRHRDVLDPENFGVCARDFIEKHYDGKDEDGKTELPADAFKSYLVRQTDDTNFIQFFSAKPYTFLERLMKRGSTQVVLARHSTLPVIVVVFRGTEAPKTSDLQARDIIDVVKDLDIWKTNLKEYGFSDGWGHAHRGFVSALQSVDDTETTSLITNKLRQLTGGDPNIGIWITGHSLGGALATLMTARVLDRMDRGEKFNLRGLYTFGSPMVGNDKFKAKMEESAQRHGVPLVRFRNHHDAVTGVPGVRAFLNYHHVGRLVLLRPDNLETPSVEPPLEHDVGDHGIAGLKGPLGGRTKTSGYYSRIVDHLQKAPANLAACAPSQK